MSDEERTEWQKEMEGLSFVNSGKPLHQVPAGYFDQLPDHIMDRWRKEHEPSHLTVISFWKRIATAAIITGICIGITWWTHQASVSSEDYSITSGEAYEYIMENIDEFAPLILQTGQLAEEKPATPESSAIEQYLIEELDGEDFENIF